MSQGSSNNSRLVTEDRRGLLQVTVLGEPDGAGGPAQRDFKKELQDRRRMEGNEAESSASTICCRQLDCWSGPMTVRMRTSLNKSSQLLGKATVRR